MPLIVTVMPGAPLVGKNDAITGNGLNWGPEVADPAGVVTVILPWVASTGTVAVI